MVIEPTHIWGIDPSTQRVSFAFVDGDDYAVETIRCAPGRSGDRLGYTHQAVRGAATRYAESYPPFVVFVEQPAGRNVHPQLWYMAGVVQAATFIALEGVFQHPVPVWTITPGDWKKLALGDGHGAAGKPEVMAWARGRGYKGLLQDEADALGIAVAGSVLVREKAPVAA